jgi:hypothetical protein
MIEVRLSTGDVALVMVDGAATVNAAPVHCLTTVRV